MEIAIIVLVSLLIVIEIYKLTKKEKDITPEIKEQLKEENNKLITTMIKENGDLKVELADSIGKSSKENIKDLNQFKENLSKELLSNFEKLNEGLDRKMDNINKKVEVRLNEGFEKTNKTFTSIVERLSKIDEAQKNIEKLSTDVVSLQHVLTDKKTRGTFGEVQLKHILESIFGENNKKVFQLQATLSNNKMVDALLHIPDPMGNLAIDSKFPLDNYQRMVNRDLTERQRVKAKREFKKDLKKHVDAIASKYIIHGETSDQAVMFIPAEAIFAEINAYHEDILEYARRKKVWMASPTTLMSLLTTVQVLLKNVERDKHAKIIHEELENLGKEFRRYKDRWDKLSSSIDTVNKRVKNIHITSRKIGDRFDEISQVNFKDSEKLEE
ncbi:MAG: DNA recombination protein RmuC [Candidatus Izimaplasma sp.]|nr:DNA recombination protein RmuC [Candidatus Izimaplasma bacterium]